MKLDSLEPAFRVKIGQLITAIESVTGRKWIITAGRRTMAEQQALYAQGRTTPGSIVTRAPAGSSAHNYGLAADLVSIDRKTGEPDWRDEYVGWQQMADLAVEMGFVAGLYFKSIKDRPHIEDPEWRVQLGLWKSGKLHVP
jgi:peptidoglycan L-alanyl-D-glutamate endopeptidase CwlK